MIPRVLVILTTHNGEQWVCEQVETILAQEGVSVRILIGDDVSRDGTHQLLNDRFGNDPRVNLVLWESPSGSAGANFRRLFDAVDLEGVDYVALSDQDDIWDKRKIRSAIEHLCLTGATGYSCAVEAFWEEGGRQKLAQAPKITAADFLFEGAGQGCTFVLTVRLFTKIRDFCKAHRSTVDKLHYHDWLVYLLARTWSEKWAFDANSWMLYRQHGANEIGARGSLRAILHRVRLIRSGWYSSQIKAAGELYVLAGGRDERVLDLVSDMNNGKNWVRRVVFATRLLFHGRRRLADRSILAASAICGWI